MQDKILQLIPMREAQRLAGLSRAGIRRLILAGKFPRPVKLAGESSRHGVRFSLAEVEAFIQQQLDARPASPARYPDAAHRGEPIAA